MTIEGFPTLLIMPDFASPPRLAGAMKYDEADLSQAARLNIFVGDRPLHNFTHKFKFTNKTDSEAFEDFLDALCGQWGGFYVPSWHAELNPAANLANGGTSLQITPVNYPTVYDPTNPYTVRLGHYIFLIDYDGTFFVSKVTAATVTGGTETLTLATAAPKQFTVGSFFVGFMYCVRPLSDSIALTYNGQGEIEADLSMTELMRVESGT